MKVLLTGANGLLGQKLIPLLANDEQIELLATGRGECRLSDMTVSFNYQPMDICEKQQIRKVFDKFKPDAVIHTAAMTQADECEQNRDNCWRINVEGIKNLLSEAEKLGSYFQFLSTDFIFDGSSGPYSEEDQPNPLNFYGETKLEGERLVQNSNLSFSIIRTVLVYGLAQDMSRSNIILWVKKNLELQKPIKVVNDQWRTPTLAEDLAKGCFLALKNKAQGIYHISGKDFLTPYQMAEMTADFFKLDKAWLTKVNAGIFSQPAKRPPRTGFVIDKAARDLNFAPHPFKSGIQILFNQLKMK